MKIAIMTQPLGRNYGGLMQAYALQRVVRELGHKVVTVDRHHNRPTWLKFAIRTVFRFAMRLIGRERPEVFVERHEKVIYKKNFSFIDNHMVLTPRLETDDEIFDFFRVNKFDALIVGSDQTWRPDYSPNIHNYFLDFIDKDEIKKIAYASSFGVDIWEFDDELTKSCSELAKRFHSISVRETSGILLCKEHLGVDAQFVVDPTFLLTAAQYLDLIGERKNSAKRILFSYVLDPNENKTYVKNVFSKLLGLEVVAYEPEVSRGLINSAHDLSDFVKPSVIEWLTTIADAEFIITDSFHGVVFSVIFQKRFIVVVNEGRGAARFHSLLGQLGLESRMFDQSKDKDFERFAESIDYDAVNIKLDLLRERSRRFLFESINSRV